VADRGVTLYSTYEPLSFVLRVVEYAHRISWLERELTEAQRVIALCAADTTAVDLRQEVEFLRAEKAQMQEKISDDRIERWSMQRHLDHAKARLEEIERG
jgi:predicted membrane-bound mannosyltransferase